MRPYILAETNWNTIRNERFDIAVLPWGATEAHNFHLPYSTDNIEADLIAAESARFAWERGAKIIVLPTIPIGVNTGQRDIYLDLNVNPSTQLAIVSDIIDVLNYQKIYKLVILNSHGGNDFRPIARELGVKYPKMFIGVCNWYQALDKKVYFENQGDHADEMETSLLLHLRPELVLPIQQWGKGKTKRIKIKELREGWAWTERKWPKITDDTGIGDPSLASREKGAKYFQDLTSKIGNLFFEICKADIEDLYE
jgi:creatinine amidohydrolase